MTGNLLVTLALAAVPTFAWAQTGARPAPGERIHLVGCVERAQKDGSLAGTGVGTTSSPNVADRDANSNELLDRFLLTAAVPAAAGAPKDTPSDLKRYALEGREAELTKHTGHRVEVTGTLAAARTAAPRKVDRAAAGSATDRVIVESVKMIAASCRQP